MRKFTCKNEDDTRRLGLELAEAAKPGAVYALAGDLGAGKTALTRYIAEGLGVKETITSPTFTIIKEYKSGRLPLYHFDVYRMESPAELEALGFEEYFYGDGLTVVEWADMVEDLLPEDALLIEIEYGEKENERIYRLYGPEDRE